MIRRRSARSSILILCTALALSACDSSSFFYTDADRRSIYTVSVTNEAGGQVSGTAVAPGAVLSVALSRMAGSSSPEYLFLELLGEDGQSLAALSYATAKGSTMAIAADVAADGTAKPASAVVTVASLGEALPPFALPADLLPGSYTLVSTLRDQSGATLQKSEVVLFVAPVGFAAGALSLYPPNPAPGNAILLEASVDRGTGGEALDPWVRWSGEGRVFASGRLSEGLDRVVWHASAAEGAYAITFEVFPTVPGTLAAESVSPWTSGLKAIVSLPLVPTTDLFADEGRFLSRLAFEGDWAELGSLGRNREPSPFGGSRLEVYLDDQRGPGGFGVRFDAAGGLALPGFALPAKEGRLLPFSFVWRLSLDKAEGDLYRANARDGSLIFRVFLAEGNPVVEVATPEGPVKSVAPLVLDAGLHDLALSFTPMEKGYALAWIVDGARVEAPALPAPSFSPELSAVLGGPMGIAGIFDEFAVSDDSMGELPFFGVAAERRWRGNLLIAEGFEANGALPQTVATSAGKVRPAPRAYALEPQASLSFLRDLPVVRPLSFEIGLAQADTSARRSGIAALVLADGAELFRVTLDGEILLPDGSLAGLVAQESAARLAFTVKSTPEGLEIVSKDKLPVARIVMKTPPKSLHLSLANASESGNLILSSVLVRMAPELLTAADAPRMARMR